MKSAPVLAVLIALAAGAGSAAMSQQPDGPGSTPREVLKSSTDRDALEHAASTLARSGDAPDLALLGQLLRDPRFLARLDDLSNFKTRHLSRVMAALVEHPTPQTAELCLALAEDAAYVAEDNRMSFLLEVLAAVKPMSQRAAALFQSTNEQGYFGFNARLLTANGSPRALGLFESMMLDKNVPIEGRVECLHVSVLPRRSEPPILRAADRIFSHASERAIATAVIESVFDFRQQWFGIESKISKPPAWQSASADSLRLASFLADKALGRRDLNPALRQTVGRTREMIMQALNTKQR